METIYLNAARLPGKEALHRELKLLLNLPDYYGMNADALHDCLAERVEPVRLYMANARQCEAPDALETVRAVVEDLGGEVIFG